MATYFVEINAHFLVKIEFDGSCCGAEHYFLDKYNCVWGANAYDEKGMKTDCFRGALLLSEIVSEDELARRLGETCDANVALTAAQTAEEDAREKVHQIEEQLAEAKEALRKAVADKYNAMDAYNRLCEVNHARRPN